MQGDSVSTSGVRAGALIAIKLTDYEAMH